MSQVLHTMKSRLPVVDVALMELRRLMSQPKVGADRDLLDKLCVGRDPSEVIDNLQAFRQAVQAGRGMDAVPLWVKVSPVLKAVNG